MDNHPFFMSRQADGALVIPGTTRLTIENAAAFAQGLREALASSPQVTVVFAAEVEADLTALQILCSACKTATAEGKSFTRQGPQPDSLRQLISAAGATRSGSCTFNPNTPCIWLGDHQ